MHRDTLNYQLPAEFTVVHWTTSYELYLQFGIEVPVSSRKRHGYIEVPATRRIYSSTLSYLPPVEFTMVKWTLRYQLNLRWCIELPITRWIYIGTLNYQLPVEFTVVHWTTSFQLKTQWYIGLPATRWTNSGTLGYQLPIEFTVVIELEATSWIYRGIMNYQLPAQFTVVYWITSKQLNLQMYTNLPAIRWIYSGT